MPLITLTTDFGFSSHYIGLVKGSILSLIPEANIIDITHVVPPFDIMYAAFILKNTYLSFPEKTIHVMAVSAPDEGAVKHILFERNGHIFIGADSGVFPLMFDEIPERTIKINHEIYENSTGSFPIKELYIPVIQQVLLGVSWEKLGNTINKWNEKTWIMPVYDGNVIKGTVIFVDNYGNIFTNIKKDLLADINAENPFTLFFKHSEYMVYKMNNNYNEVPEGELVVFFNTSGNLEIAINRGNAGELLGLQPGDTVRLELENSLI